MWQLGALHKIESEDVVNAVIKFANGATGVVQASTAFWPGYTERTEFHGTKGTAIISGDKLTTWDVENDAGDPAPLATEVASGASRPDGHFARALRTPVPGFRRGHRAAAGSRRSRVKRDTRRWRSWTPSTVPAAPAKKSRYRTQVSRNVRYAAITR